MTLLEQFKLVGLHMDQDKFDVNNLWDLVNWMGTNYPQEDIYLNVLGELESDSLDINFPNYKDLELDNLDMFLTGLVEYWYRLNNVNWWGKFKDVDGSIQDHMDQ